MTLLYGLLVGVAMGWLLQRVRASSPAMIASNLRLQNLSIIKFMALAIAVGAVAVAALAAVGVPMHFDIKPTYLVGVLGGGLVFGVGFALGGYCPGTCGVGAGEGREDALFAILGGVVGALLFTVAYPAIERVFVAPLNYGRVTVPGLLGVPAMLLAVALAAVVLAAVTRLPTERGGAAGRASR